MTSDKVPPLADLASALSGSVSAAMNLFGRAVQGFEIPRLVWTPLPSDDRYDYDGGLLRGYADYPPAEVPEVLSTWALVLSLEPAPDLEADELRYIGVIGRWNVEIAGRTGPVSTAR